MPQIHIRWRNPVGGVTDWYQSQELDEHVPIYVLEPNHPEYHVPSDDDIQEDSIDYPDEPEDDDEDPEEDPDED
ncbi:hypothetical protein Tco_1114115 [Tanacetum coccineum]|uniref:Uncharacterized protein n=1 Tax=Tanacetum coccineum TaxID=301880 RepID=A0ABQ5IU55_9ASTR